MNKQFFITIADHIKISVPEIRWIDADDQQLSSSDRPPLAWPACLIDISYPRCETLMGGRQKIHARVELRVAFEAIQGRTNATAPIEVREKAMQRLDVLEHVHRALQWYDGNGIFNPMRRTSSTPEHRSDGLKVYKVIYETEFFD